jgi:hypothetical protein
MKFLMSALFMPGEKLLGKFRKLKSDLTKDRILTVQKPIYCKNKDYGKIDEQ